MRDITLITCLALASCGGEDASETAPEITEASDPDEPTETPEAPSVPEEPEEEAVERVTFELPEGRPARFEQLRTRTVNSRGSVWDEIRHANPLAQRRFNTLVTQLAYAAGAVPVYEYMHREVEVGGCHVMLATERIVSVQCRPMEWHSNGEALFVEGRLAAHFVIDGDVVRPFDLADALVEGETFADLVDRPHCVSRLLNATGAPSGSRERPAICNRMLPEARAVITPTGIDLMLGTFHTVSCPWSTIREHLRPEGPIAWLFEAVDREPAPSREDSDGWSVGPIVPETELATGFAALPEGVAADVRVASRGIGAGQLVVPVALGWPRAHAIAEALGVTPRRTMWDHVRRLVRVRTTRETVVTGRATGAELRRVPTGTYFTVLTAAAEGVGELPVRAAASRRRSGWLNGAHLAVAEGCEPPVEPFLEGFDEGAADALMISKLSVHTEDGELEAALYSTRADSQFQLRVVAIDEDCAPTGEPLLDVTTRGWLFDLRTTTTESDGGLTLVVVGVTRGEERTYVVYQLGSGAPVLRASAFPHEYDSDETDVWGRLPPFLVGVVDQDHGAYFPFRSEYGGSWVWNGRRLVPPDDE